MIWGDGDPDEQHLKHQNRCTVYWTSSQGRHRVKLVKVSQCPCSILGKESSEAKLVDSPAGQMHNLNSNTVLPISATTVVTVIRPTKPSKIYVGLTCIHSLVYCLHTCKQMHRVYRHSLQDLRRPGIHFPGHPSLSYSILHYFTFSSGFYANPIVGHARTTTYGRQTPDSLLFCGGVWGNLIPYPNPLNPSPV